MELGAVVCFHIDASSEGLLPNRVEAQRKDFRQDPARGQTWAGLQGIYLWLDIVIVITIVMAAQCW